MNINDIKKVEITSLDHQGRGMGRIDNIVIFIPNTITGDVVNAKIVKIKKNYMEGEAVDYITLSPKRVEPKCKYFGICGGCDLMHLSYDDQVLYKENKVKDIMKKYADIEYVNNIVKCDNPYNYRNKVTFQVDSTIGLYKKKSYDIVNIDKCELIDDKINKYLSLFKKMNLNGIKQVVVRTSYNDSLIIFYCDKDIMIDTSLFDCNVVKCFDKKFTTLKGNNYIIEMIGNKKYKISPTSFFQVNTNQAYKLYELVKEYLELDGTEKVLDLYCGTGTIGIYVADKAKEVFGIEINKEAITDANYNKELNNLKNISFKSGDSGKTLKEVGFIPNKIIVDPPRAGLDTNVINQLIELKPERIVYVSCDPITLARDLNILKNNFMVEKVTPVDMFCNTYHVENVVSLRLIK